MYKRHILNIVFFLAVVIAISSEAQPFFDVNTSIVSCDDYATQVLHNPWDMADTADINHFISNDVTGIANASFSSGLFNFTNAETAGGHFYLLSPQIDSLQPVGGRWGQNFPIDSSKYRQLTVRMGLSVADPSNFGLRVLWHRGKLGASGSERTITNLGTLPTKTGWRSYSLDLSSLGSFDSSSSNAQAWTAAQVMGIGLYPLVSQGSGQIDYIRLEDPVSCGSTSVAYTTSVSGNNDLLSFYLDDDSTPVNGFLKKLASSVSAASNSSLSVSSLGLMPGTYKIVAHFNSDYATLERNNSWDMNESTDISSAGGIASTSFSGGVFSGTTTDSSPNIFFDIPTDSPIDASKYGKLSLKINRSGNMNSDPMLLFWTKTDGGSGFEHLTQAVHDPDNDQVYHYNLSADGDWNGLINSLRLQATTVASSGVTFALDFLQIRKTGLVTNEADGSIIASASSLTISDPPRIQVLQPDIKGGELFKVWDVREGDIGLAVNADGGSDSSHPGESLTTFLPDVRSVDGVRGNIYKATNNAGDGDPNDYLNFPAAGNNRYSIDASQYQNLCIKMTLNRDYDLALGSVTKHFYKQADQDFQSADAWATIYDRWSSSRWYEYCLDAKNHPTESNQMTWGGTLEAFRIDPHEFSFDNCCDGNGNPFGNPLQATTYYDYIRLAKRDYSYGKFSLAYQVQDSDTAIPAVTWFYSSTSNFLVNTQIPSGSLSCQGQVCVWDTTAIANGEYYVKAVVSDGSSANTARATGSVVVSNGNGAVEVAPILYMQNPSNGGVICSDMQVKGFAVNNSIDEPVVAVQVFIDGTFNQLVVPNEYSPLSQSNYPSRISDSGFNFSIPISALAVGAHTVLVKAYSSNGGIDSQSITVNRQAGCSDTVVSDELPAGSPQPVTTSAPDATPTPSVEVPTLAKASHSKKGAVMVLITGASSSLSDCSVVLQTGVDARSLQDLKSYQLSAKDFRSGKLNFKGSKLRVNSRKLKNVILGAYYSCSGASGSVATRTLKFRGSGSIKSINALRKKLGRLLKKR